ncbi:glutathione S-transferase 2 isoform 3 [Triticum aestivum]|uniref:glutathione S-transferase 2 isoform 3 n=1 Tax=Triticum aestivum TaxID=4565 RepID=UPI002AF6B63F|nr:glutathione S-transferase 2 isoform 3 [Triticum aestivum]
MSPVKVFGHPMLTNVARVLLFLEEVGAEYELVPVDFVAGEHKRPQHVQLNPFAKMPGFQDGESLHISTHISTHESFLSRSIMLKIHWLVSLI